MSPRRLLIAVATLATCATTATPASAAETLPMTALEPADGAGFVASATATVPFAISGAPANASIYVRVSTTPNVGTDGMTLSDLNTADFFSLYGSTTDVGVFRGQSHGGVATWWNAVPGTYYWQAQGHWLSYDDPATPQFEGAFHQAVGPIRRIVIQAPPAPPTRTSAGTLRLSDAREATRDRLTDEYARYRRGTNRRIRCSRTSIRAMTCRATFRYRRVKYLATVRVTRDGEGIWTEGSLRRQR